jgi:hypothetical protein
MNELIDIWGRLIASSTYVVWTKARIWFMKAKWSIEDELHIMKPTKRKAHKSNNTQRIIEETNELKTSIIQREKGFI